MKRLSLAKETLTSLTLPQAAEAWGGKALPDTQSQWLGCTDYCGTGGGTAGTTCDASQPCSLGCPTTVNERTHRIGKCLPG